MILCCPSRTNALSTPFCRDSTNSCSVTSHSRSLAPEQAPNGRSSTFRTHKSNVGGPITILPIKTPVKSESNSKTDVFIPFPSALELWNQKTFISDSLNNIIQRKSRALDSWGHDTEDKEAGNSIYRDKLILKIGEDKYAINNNLVIVIFHILPSLIDSGLRRKLRKKAMCFPVRALNNYLIKTSMS